MRRYRFTRLSWQISRRKQKKGHQDQTSVPHFHPTSPHSIAHKIFQPEPTQNTYTCKHTRFRFKAKRWLALNETNKPNQTTLKKTTAVNSSRTRLLLHKKSNFHVVMWCEKTFHEKQIFHATQKKKKQAASHTLHNYHISCDAKKKKNLASQPHTKHTFTTISCDSKRKKTPDSKHQRENDKKPAVGKKRGENAEAGRSSWLSPGSSSPLQRILLAVNFCRPSNILQAKHPSVSTCRIPYCCGPTPNLLTRTYHIAGLHPQIR